MKEGGKSKLIYYLSLIGFFAIFSTTISKNPVLSLYTQALGANDFLIGLIAAFSPLAGILFSFPLGVLSDKIGKKKLLVFSGVIFLVSPLLYLFVTSAVWLIPIRFFHGMATAILGPIVSAMIVGVYSKNKGEKLGIYISSTLVGRTLAPLLGGFIISYFAFATNLLNYKYVYIAAFILSIPVFFMLLFLKGESKRKSKIYAKDFLQDLKLIFANKKVLSTALVEMAIYFAYGSFETYIPIYLASKSIPVYQIGIIFASQVVAIALSQPIFGKIADKIDKRIQISVGILMMGISISLITLFSSISSMIIIGLIFGLGLSFSSIAINPYVADIVGKNKLGASIGGLSSIMDIGNTFGPFLTGIAISYLSFSGGFLASFAVAIISVIIFVLCNKK